MRLVSCSDRKSVLTSAAARLQELFAEHSDQSVLFLSSGGSALKILDHLDGAIPTHMTFGVVDDRWSMDPAVNNLMQLQATEYYQKAIAAGAYTLIDVPDADDTREQYAKRFEAALHGWRDAHPGGIIIATMGVGADGHTAGIMTHPDNPESFEQRFRNDPWAVSYDAQNNQHPERITTTLTFLCSQVDHAVAVMYDEPKRGAFVKLTAGEGEVRQTPARIFHEMKDVSLFHNF